MQRTMGQKAEAIRETCARIIKSEVEKEATYNTFAKNHADLA